MPHAAGARSEELSTGTAHRNLRGPGKGPDHASSGAGSVTRPSPLTTPPLHRRVLPPGRLDLPVSVLLHPRASARALARASTDLEEAGERSAAKPREHPPGGGREGATTQSPGRDVIRRAYQWSAPDQIAAIVDRHSGKATHYEHDPRGYLIKQILADGKEVHRAADPAGNLFKTPEKRDRTYGRGGVIKRADGTHYKVDDDGFLTQKTLSDGATWKYKWDGQGRLTEVERPDKKKVAFTYDAFGRRTTKTFEGKTTEFVWDGDDLVHERVHDADGTVSSPVTTWVFEPGMFTPLAKLEGRKRFGVVTDHLGTPAILTTEAGAIAWRAQLDVYGVVREEEGVARDENRTANPWRFPGQYEDAETGLYYNRFRYYDPELGRYLSEDPIGLHGGVNLGTYVANTGTTVDVFGLAPVSINEGGPLGPLEDRAVTGDNLTPHHMPQDKLGFLPRRQGGAVMMTQADHELTRTFGAKGRRTAAEDAGESFRKVLAKDIRDLRQKFGSKYDDGIRQMLDYYKKEHPDLINKPPKACS